MRLKALLFGLWPFENSAWETAVSVFVNSTNITTNIETVVLSKLQLLCRSMEGLKEEEEKKKLKEKEEKMAKLVKIVEMDKFTEEKTRYKN